MNRMDPLQPPATPQDKPAVLTVSSLNRLARSLLEGHFPAVIVEGEISNLAQPSSGHWYMTLKDRNSQIRCAMFANRNRSVRFRPQNGQQVIVRGKLSIYEGRGDYQLIAESLEAAGDGALQRAFEELKAKLDAEGLFEAQHKQTVDDSFRHIALVTSATGAAIRDLISVFRRRFPAIRLTLIPVSVQGQQAAAEIVAAIATANRLRSKLGIEALIVGRGGGSLEDLQAFNEESVARAIFASKLPVTSAVGHEIDFTIADFVADLRAPTPSAAAELMSPSQAEYIEQFAAYRQVLGQSMLTRLRSLQQSVQALQRHLKRPDRRLQDHAQTLDRLELRLRRASQQGLQRNRQRLEQLNKGLLAQSPLLRIERLHQDVRRYRHSLQTAIRQRCQSTQSRLAELSRSLNAVSPLNTLARGYSITFDAQGTIVQDASNVAVGSTLVTRLARGEIKATVVSTAPESAAKTAPDKKSGS